LFSFFKIAKLRLLIYGQPNHASKNNIKESGPVQVKIENTKEVQKLKCILKHPGHDVSSSSQAGMLRIFH
jgi:hypothetical protein